MDDVKKVKKEIVWLSVIIVVIIGAMIAIFSIVGGGTDFDEARLNRVLLMTWGQRVDNSIFKSIDVEDEDIKDTIINLYSKYGKLDEDRIHIENDGYKKEISIDGAGQSVTIFYNKIGYLEDSIRFVCKRIVREATELNEPVNGILLYELNNYFKNDLVKGYLNEAIYDKETNTVTLSHKDKKWNIDLNE